MYIFLSNFLSHYRKTGLGFMVFNATFNNSSVKSWWSVLLVKVSRVPGENHTPAAIHKRYHITLFRVHFAWAGFELTMLVVIFTNCIGSYKSNYHAITTTAAPRNTEIVQYHYKKTQNTWMRIKIKIFPQRIWKTCFILIISSWREKERQLQIQMEVHNSVILKT